MKGFDFDKELSLLPDKPGVYLMYSSSDTVIYVGKAKILKNRVRQYFQNTKNHTPKVRAMVKNIAYFEYIITDSEIEALVLECNLIKKYRPKYNILLKDDKHYPYIKVTLNEDYPRIFLTRELKNDGARYFGPYSSSQTVKSVIELTSRLFRQPNCKRKFPKEIGKGRPCLNYHIKTCFAPCVGNITKDEYREIFYNICTFLSGNHKEILTDLKTRMTDASKNMEFEYAAKLRDEIIAIERLDEKQKIINSDNLKDLDVISAFIHEDQAYCSIFFVRMGKVIGRENFTLIGAKDREYPEIITDFIKQFYKMSASVPSEILTDTDIIEKELLENWLSGIRTRKVKITKSVRGEKKHLLEMVKKNAENACLIALSTKAKFYEKIRANSDLSKLLGIENIKYIEAYDISNISGTDNVGSVVVFKDGKPFKERYRKFNIKSFEGADDYKAMQEVLYRRIKRAYEEEELIEKGELSYDKAKFLPLPDIFLIDGGEGHLSSANEILEMMSVDIPAFGMVKDDKHRTKGLVSKDGEIEINRNSSVFKLICEIQDEVHRVAITHHRNKRAKKLKKSILDSVPGIGEKRKKILLKEFKTIERIKNASFDELSKIVPKDVAESIKEHLK